VQQRNQQLRNQAMLRCSKFARVASAKFGSLSQLESS
jgi:hypothetical protein